MSENAQNIAFFTRFVGAESAGLSKKRGQNRVKTRSKEKSKKNQTNSWKESKKSQTSIQTAAQCFWYSQISGESNMK